ncbi:MAG TPA: hypothetical protein VGT02_03805 [Methylomirabilota bacterium]|nr:hypothetical protein [Methylomirabilota bacterium]
MPNFLRESMAREGHEATFREALIGVHERMTRGIPHLMEVLLYREHFTARRFLSIVRYDDERAVQSDERRQMLDALTAIETAHCEAPAESRPLELLYEYATIPQQGQHGVVALLTASSQGTAIEVGRRMAGGAGALVDRLKPTRLIVARVLDRLRLLVMLDATDAIDIDRYLASSMRRRHMDAVAPYLAAPPQWYALDPVFRYFRRSG